WLGEPRFNGSYRFVGEEIITSRPDHLLAPGMMHMSSFEFEVVHTPGHSPGSVSFIFHKERIVFSGDVLFQQGIGRTDLIGGSMEQLAASIKTHLYTLDDGYTIYPGHGSETSIGAEKRNKHVYIASNYQNASLYIILEIYCLSRSRIRNIDWRGKKKQPICIRIKKAQATI